MYGNMRIAPAQDLEEKLEQTGHLWVAEKRCKEYDGTQSGLIIDLFELINTDWNIQASIEEVVDLVAVIWEHQAQR